MNYSFIYRKCIL